MPSDRHHLGFALVLVVASWSATAPTFADALPNTMVNYRLADTDGHDTQSSTALVLSAGSVILCSFTDTGSNTLGNNFTGIARSTDLGTTWLDQGSAPANPGGNLGEPCLARSAATGTVILTTLALDTTRVNAYRSTDNGASYAAPLDASGGGHVVNRPYIACDSFPGSGSGNLYVAYRDFGATGSGMHFTRSTNDGLTWSTRTPLLLGDTGTLAWVVVGADHAVYVFWLNSGSGSNEYVFRKSLDLGVSFGPVTPVATLRTTGESGDLGLGGAFRTPDDIQVVASPTNANQLYAVWADKAPSPGTDKANVCLSQTTNGGATWSAPVLVNSDGGENDQWQPVIALTPDGAALFVSWYDRRLDAANSLIDVYGRVAAVAGSTLSFAPDFRITSTSFPVVVGQDSYLVPNYMGGYDTAVADNSAFYRTWGDNRFPNGMHLHQPDVFFTKVPRAGTGISILPGASSLTDENCAANGAPDPNERVDYSLSLSNQGSAPTTNLVATLQSGDGVVGPSGPQSYGALAVGASAARGISFKATGACGGSMTAVLDLQDGATHIGTVAFPLGLGASIGPIGPALYSSGDIAERIPASGTMGDMNDVSIVVPSSDEGQVVDVNARVRLNHTFDGDLLIQLVSPAGTVVTLCDTRGSSGDDFGMGANGCSSTHTVFDDAAAMPIGAGVAPFAGSYRPEGALAAFNGESPVGTWKLKIHDGSLSDSGTLYCWQLEITRALVTCASCAVTAVGGAAPPIAFAAWPNRPNPFTRSTEIRYVLPQRVPVELVVYTVDGRRVATLVNEVQGPGKHSVSFGSDLATADGNRLGALKSGVYFYRLRAGPYMTARKMVFVR